MKRTYTFLAPFLIAGSLFGETIELSLSKVLELANDNNTELLLQLEQVKQAEFDQKIAWYNWIPDLRVGGQYSDQDGLLQSTNGSTERVRRDSLSKGLGFGGTGSGMANNPGLSLELDLADAFFDPKIAERKLSAARHAESGTSAEVSLRAAELYYDLLEAHRGIELVEAGRANADSLAEVTQAFAEGGQGLQSDAEQALVYSMLLENQLEEARYRYASAEARLTSFLALDDATRFRLSDAAIAPLQLYASEPEFASLVAGALKERPEMKEAEALGEASQVARDKQKWSPLVPSVSANFSYGDFEGDSAGFARESGDRTEYSVAVFWELDGLGLTNHAELGKRASVYRQTRAAAAQVRADVSAEVKLAHDAMLHSRKQISVLEKTVEHARSAYEQTRDRVFENQGLPLEALQSMRVLEETEKLMVRAITRYNLAQLRLLTVSGKHIQPALSAN